MKNILIYFDVETTGLNPLQNSIHQLSLLIEIDSRVVESYDFKIKPHPRAIVEKSALEISGITEAEIQKYPEMRIVHEQLIAILAKHLNRYDKKDKAHLVGYNNRSFDDQFLRKFFELCGDSFFGSWFWSDSIDVLCLASEYLRSRRSSMPNFKLGSVAKELGIVLDESRLHDAVYDCEVTRTIHQIVTKKIDEPL